MAPAFWPMGTTIRSLGSSLAITVNTGAISAGTYAMVIVKVAFCGSGQSASIAGKTISADIWSSPVLPDGDGSYGTLRVGSGTYDFNIGPALSRTASGSASELSITFSINSQFNGTLFIDNFKIE
jgi:hypothetical protein